MKYLYQHGDKLYLILRKLPEHMFLNSDGNINMEVLKVWRDHIGGDHVLKQQNYFLIAETIQDIEIEEEII